jgi:RNA polymerase sigma-70 factor (ECF subfamily)
MTTLLESSRHAALDDDVDLVRDRVLVERAQAGDRSAFDDLYLRYYRRLYRFCIRRLQDAHEAEDVTQESFARAWRALPSFAGDRRFYPWLSVIASHLCTDVARRRSRSTPVAELHQTEMASTDDGGEDRLVAAVDSDLVARAFLRLSTRHQRILRLREGSGWSYQMIADHEGVGITAIETLLWRARQALKREFAALADVDGGLAGVAGVLLGARAIRQFFGSRLAGARRMAQSHPWSASALGSAAASVVLVAATAPGATTATGPTASPPKAASSTPFHEALGVAHVGTPGWSAPKRLRTHPGLIDVPRAGEPGAPPSGAPSASGGTSPLNVLAGLGNMDAASAGQAIGTVVQAVTTTVSGITSTLTTIATGGGASLPTESSSGTLTTTSLTIPLGDPAEPPSTTAPGRAGAACVVRASVGAVTSIITGLAGGPSSSAATGSSCPR